VKDYRAAFINPNAALLGPKFKFAKHGQSGAELSELLPASLKSWTTSPSSSPCTPMRSITRRDKS